MSHKRVNVSLTDIALQKLDAIQELEGLGTRSATISYLASRYLDAKQKEKKDHKN